MYYGFEKGRPVTHKAYLADAAPKDGILGHVESYRETCVKNMEALMALRDRRAYEERRLDVLRQEIAICSRMLGAFSE